MISQEQAQQFAEEWIDAWNSHDLKQILSLYADDFEMSSPKIIRIANEPSGKLQGKVAVSSYWKRALQQLPDLHFQLLEVFAGVESICLRYNSASGHSAVEWFLVDHNFKIQKAAAHYAEIQPLA